MANIPRLVINGPIGEPDPFLILEGVDNSVSADYVANWLDRNKKAKEIEVEIRSNGGSVTQGFMIHDLLINSGKKITTIGYNVKSIATVIFLAGSVRRLAPNAEFLIHNPWIDPAQLGYAATADTLQEAADDMAREEDRLAGFYAFKLSLNQDRTNQLRAVMDNDSNMTPAEALNWGFATEIIQDASARVRKLEAFAYSDKIKTITNMKNKNVKNDAEAKTAFDGLFAGFKTLAKKLGIVENSADVQNGSIELADATGSVYFDGADVADGIAVFSDDAMSTPLAAGDYILMDGRTITVDDAGVITAIIPAADTSAEGKLKEQIAALKIANARLVNESKDKDAEINALKAEKEETKAELTKLTDSMAEIEKTYFSVEPGTGAAAAAQAQDIKDKPQPTKPSRYKDLKTELSK